MASISVNRPDLREGPDSTMQYEHCQVYESLDQCCQLVACGLGKAYTVCGTLQQGRLETPKRCTVVS